MAEPDLLTIAEAGRALNLSGERIHQLLKDGPLQGVPLPPGRKRHAPGAPRVARASVERLRAERVREETEAAAERTVRRRTGQVSVGFANEGSGPAGSGRESEKARAAALELKVRMDTLRDQLREERARNSKLLESMEILVRVLRDTTASSNALDDVTDGYSQALTQFLAPDTPPADP